MLQGLDVVHQHVADLEGDQDGDRDTEDEQDADIERRREVGVEPLEVLDDVVHLIPGIDTDGGKSRRLRTVGRPDAKEEGRRWEGRKTYHPHLRLAKGYSKEKQERRRGRRLCRF